MRMPARLLIPVLLLGAGPALAHHPLAGLPMETGMQGVLSGLAHPVLGFDHLFFVLAAGVAAMLAGQPLRGPLAYVGAMLAGCALALSGYGLPLVEGVIALSLLVLGGLILSGRALTPVVILPVIAGFGLFHGAAFATGIAGAEGGAAGPVFAGYLLGLGVMQYALALGAGFLAARAGGIGALRPRLTGAMVAGVGLFLCLDAMEGPLVAVIAGLAG